MLHLITKCRSAHQLIEGHFGSPVIIIYLISYFLSMTTCRFYQITLKTGAPVRITTPTMLADATTTSSKKHQAFKAFLGATSRNAAKATVTSSLTTAGWVLFRHFLSQFLAVTHKSLAMAIAHSCMDLKIKRLRVENPWVQGFYSSSFYLIC